MKIFVTGANGFVGAHLVEHLLAEGHQVTAAVRRAGLAPAGAREVVSGELGPLTDWEGMLDGEECVIHLAARVHVMNDDSADPLAEFRRINTAGTLRLAAAAAQQGVPRFIFLSSIKVNGESTSNSPFAVSDTPNPTDSYALSKLEAEVGLRDIEDRSDVDVVIVRTPLVYGPGVGGNFINLLRIAHKGIPLPLGSVRNRRTMISVWNLADLLETVALGAGGKKALVLAGDAESLSTAALLRLVRAAMGKPSRLFPFPVPLISVGAAVLGRKQFVERLTGSLEVAVGASSAAWRWSPPVSVKSGIQRTVDWYLGEPK